MFKKTRLAIMTLAVAGIAAGAATTLPSTLSAAAEGAAFTDAQKSELDGLIKDYLMKNPQVILDAVQKHQENQENVEIEAMKKTIAEKKDALFNDPGSPVAGNEKGTVVVVEFFDYMCGYCKRALDDVQQIIEKDKDVKIVFKDFPILSEDSHTAARYALASAKQGKYMEMHTALMKASGSLNESRVLDLAKGIGLDVEKLKTDASSEEIAKQLEKDTNLARDLGINGTPGFVINETPVRGYLGYDGMQGVIDSERAKLKK